MTKINDETNITLTDFDLYVYENDNSDNYKKEKRVNVVSRFRVTNAHNSIISFFHHHLFLDYIVKRAIFALLTMFLLISLFFLIFRLAIPETTFLKGLHYDKNKIIPGTAAYDNMVHNRMVQLHLNGSLWKQLWTFWVDFLPFSKKTVSFGKNVQVLSDGTLSGLQTTHVWVYYGVVLNNSLAPRPMLVAQIFGNSIPVTLVFAVTSIIASYFFGIIIGFFIAYYRDRYIDKTIKASSVLIRSTPPIVMILIIYYITAYGFGWSEWYTAGTFSSRFVPFLVMFIIQTPYLINKTRSLVIEELNATYSKFALAKGMVATRVLSIHVFRNILLALTRTIPKMVILSIFGSAIFTETYWQIPGVSHLIVSGIKTNEVFIVRTYLILLVTTIIWITALSDIISTSLMSKYQFSD